MTARKKISNKVELKLVKDASDDDAWDAPLSVPPSQAPRPAWYGQATHLELAAKFYVLYFLHRLGAEATLTYAQPDNVDIAAVRRSGEAFTIDVKTLTGTSLWLVDPFRARPYHFVVFVCFKGEWHDPQEKPEIYMWSSESLKALITRDKATTVSLKDVASKLDPMSAWEAVRNTAERIT
jgi:hypothetical protein